MKGGGVALRVVGLSAGYGAVDVLQHVSLAVEARSLVVIIGPNGAGKSTLLKALYGVLQPRQGCVRLSGPDGERDVTATRPDVLTRFGMNYVPQLDNVFPNMSVLENLEIGAFTLRRRKREELERAFTRFPLLYERRQQRAGTLSGGQRKLLALARALVSDPSLILLDEPSAGLSPAAADKLFETLEAINRDGIAIAMVEQNARRSLAMADYAYVLDMGQNRYEGPGQQLLDDPRIADLYLGSGRHQPLDRRAGFKEERGAGPGPGRDP